MAEVGAKELEKVMRSDSEEEEAWQRAGLLSKGLEAGR